MPVTPTMVIYLAAAFTALACYGVIATIMPAARVRAAWGRTRGGMPLSTLSWAAWTLLFVSVAIILAGQALEYAPVVRLGPWLMTGSAALIAAAAIVDSVRNRATSNLNRNDAPPSA